MFHSRCGNCVVLSNGNKTAARINPTQEFNRGLVFSFEPLKNNEIFEVTIDKKLNTWSGSIEIGVTVSNPDVIEVPITATDLKGGTWIMLGQGVFRDGQSLHEAYGCDLDKLVEGDRVGVMRNTGGDLLFYINGECQGVASRNLPSIVYAVIDMYGKCAQITITRPSSPASCPLDGDSAEETIESLRESELSESNNTSTPSAPLPAAPTEDLSLMDTVMDTFNGGLALRHHMANISVANTCINAAGHDSNLLEDERDSCDSGHHPLPPTSAAPIVAVSSPTANEECESSNGVASHQWEVDSAESAVAERLRFHWKTGVLVRLSGNGRTAERKRPMDEFNHGVVMSNRALRVDEMFEIRIDRLVNKWSGSVEVGITTHNPGHLEFPATMTSMRSGTIMMSGTAILTNGKGTLREYGTFDLDKLKEGDRIGMMIREGRDLHYFINGQEQGIAASNVPHPVWAVVDLYGMTVKVSMLDSDHCSAVDDCSLDGEDTRPNQEAQSVHIVENNLNANHCCQNDSNVFNDSNINSEPPLLFHRNCGSYAEVVSGGKTALRPNATDDFNNGVVLSNRHLLPDEIFEVHLDTLVDKWAGTLEIGVTTHSPLELEFPSTMSNVRSGTWLMTTNSISHNGSTIVETQFLNFDKLKVGDRIGVCRKRDGTLHFYFNGSAVGIALSNIPEKVYGVVDLYGQAAQVTLSSTTSRCVPSSTALNDVLPDASNAASSIYSDLRFHERHGQNVRVAKGGLGAHRPNADSEFNDAIVMTNRPLLDGEMFEVVIERMVDRWSGSLEAGMTAISPEQIEFPSTMTDIDYETWMLSGSSVMRNGITTMNNYGCDLDSLAVGTRIGMTRHSDGTLHYYVNGEDQGVACRNLKTGLWGVIDLYGRCAQVSIVHSPLWSENSFMSISPYLEAGRLSISNLASAHANQESEVMHQWSKCCGANILVNDNMTIATRVRHFNHGLLFSSCPLENDEIFEVRLEKMNLSYSGCLRVGLTTFPVSDSTPSGSVPSSLTSLESADTWWVDGSTVRRNGCHLLKLNYCPSLRRLRLGDSVGVKRAADRTFRLSINGMDFGVAATNISKRVFAIVELFGSAESVSISSLSRILTPIVDPVLTPVGISHDSLDLPPPVTPRTLPPAVTFRGPTSAVQESHVPSGDAVPAPQCTTSGSPFEWQTSPHLEIKFHDNRGRNIQLSADKTFAKRIESYNQGILFSASPLPRDYLFQVRLGTLHPRWSSSITIGVTTECPDKLSLPNSAFDMKRNTWLFCSDSVFYNGVKIKGRYGPNLDSLSDGVGGHVVGVLIDRESQLHLCVNGVDQGVAAREIPSNPYCVVDVYGQCQEVTVVNNYSSSNASQRDVPSPVDLPRQFSITTADSFEQNEPHTYKNLKNQHHHYLSLQQQQQQSSSLTPSHNHSLHHNKNLQQQQQMQLHVITSSHPAGSVCRRSGPRGSVVEQTNNDEVNVNRRSKNNLQLDRVVPVSPLKDKIKIPTQGTCSESISIKNCEYQNLCGRFRSSLALPDAYFSREDDLCFCETCHKIRGGEQFHTKGNPPKRYAQPIGWCRFSLVTSVGEKCESWHMAYHGIKGGAVRRVLDKGELLFEGELGVNTRLPNKKTKDEASDGSVLSFSPSISYASLDEFAPTVNFVDGDSKRELRVKMVLQIAVEPGSYKVFSPSSSSPPVAASAAAVVVVPSIPQQTTGDASSENENCRWVTKERGATQLLALLVKVDHQHHHHHLGGK